ncbi:branched-chain amino acid ABC transporter permease [Geminicoccus harenae]|uniref:branched-chain amino acid ABC transporter permease n=1 Tax=Geminicoccus harenae TaxID=2498453 RepID=UPI00168AA61D|nr:branched-chain amino acid ABC transporter permease [Geminicoccus harenae]
MINFAQTFIDALSLGSLYALAALGIGLLFGILRLINFAYGDLITLGAYALIIPSTEAVATLFIGGWPWFMVIIAVAVIVVAAALLSDLLVFRHIRRADPATLMIASFAVSFVIQNVILMFYGSRPKSVDLWSNLNYQIAVSGLRIPLLQIVTILATLVLMGGLTLLLKRTALGIQMRAAAEDFRMARYLGVRGNLVIGLAFAISGVLAAVASLLLLSQTGTLSQTMGVPLMLFAFIATVVGGMGSLIGAATGGFAVAFASVFLQAYLPDDLRPFRDSFVFGIVILMLLFRPAGLVPTKALVERV